MRKSAHNIDNSDLSTATALTSQLDNSHIDSIFQLLAGILLHAYVVVWELQAHRKLHLAPRRPGGDAAAVSSSGGQEVNLFQVRGSSESRVSP